MTREGRRGDHFPPALLAKPIHSPYLIGHNEANFIGCHQPVFLDRYECWIPLPRARCSWSTRRSGGKVWNSLTRRMQQQIIAKKSSSM